MKRGTLILRFREIFSFRFYLTAIMFAGSLQVAAYWIAGMMASVDGTFPTAQPDTLLYCQAARRIAEGHPFSFAAGEAVSTGTTSVLYPFALAVPYVCGFRVDSLFAAGFLLNAGFYLIFLGGWALAFWRWLPRPSVRLLAGLLLVLAGQPAFCAFSQSDTGMMMAVGGVFAAGLAWERPWIWGLALVFAPWIRPEGMMLIVGLGGTLVLRRVLFPAESALRPSRMTWGFVIAAIVSSVGVFALNYWLTGECQFSSVVEKGYFKRLPFSSAVNSTIADVCQLLRTYLLGLGSGSFRDTVLFPLLGGGLSLAGILAFWTREGGRIRWGVMPLVLAATLSLGTVASSGWQGTNFDRYLAWMQPLVFLFLAVGAVTVGERLGRSQKIILTGALAVFGAVSSVSALAYFKGSSQEEAQSLLFARAMDKAIPQTASVGSVRCGYAYFLGNRPFYHLSGIYSPEFDFRGRIDAAARIEKLRREPRSRPDFLIATNPDSFSGFSAKEMDKVATQVLTGPRGQELRKMNWTMFDASLAASLQPTGKVLVAEVDVGSVSGERASGFEVVDKWARTPGDPFIHIGKLDGREIVDCGRVVEGEASMTVPLAPGRETALVVRTVKRETARYRGEFATESTEFLMDDRLEFNLSVDGVLVGVVAAELPAVKGEDFAEFCLTIPGSAIGASPCRVTLAGDHVVCCYRFYQ